MCIWKHLVDPIKLTVGVGAFQSTSFQQTGIQKYKGHTTNESRSVFDAIVFEDTEWAWKSSLVALSR
jgi:hypothetical protein